MRSEAGGNALADLARATKSTFSIDTRMGLGAESPAWLDITSAAWLRPSRSGLATVTFRSLHSKHCSKETGT